MPAAMPCPNTPPTDPRGATPMKSRIDKETAVNRLVNSFMPLRCKLLPLDRDMHNFDLRIVGAGGKEVDIPLDVSPYQLRDVKRLERVIAFCHRYIAEHGLAVSAAGITRH